MGANLKVIEVDDATGKGVGGCGLGCWRLGAGGFGAKGVLPVHTAEERGEPGEEDAEVEGLGEVVVGTSRKAFDDVFGAPAGGEKEDGGVTAGFAKSGDEIAGIWIRRSGEFVLIQERLQGSVEFVFANVI